MDSGNAYEKWLKEQLMIQEGGEIGFYRLCEKMHRTPFLPFLPMDWNRNDEALELRVEWVESVTGDIQEQVEMLGQISETMETDFCSVLELMVIVVRRIQYETMDGDHEASMRKWFFELMDNCGLYSWNDEKWAEDPEKAEEEVERILGVLIFRKYGWDGEGGMFPLAYCRCDQRKTELLTQMNYYIEENYDIC